MGLVKIWSYKDLCGTGEKGEPFSEQKTQHLGIYGNMKSCCHGIISKHIIYIANTLEVKSMVIQTCFFLFRAIQYSPGINLISFFFIWNNSISQNRNSTQGMEYLLRKYWRFGTDGIQSKKHIDNMQMTKSILYAFNSDGNRFRKIFNLKTILMILLKENYSEIKKY